MFQASAPREYTAGEYLSYQRRYAGNVRESDKVLTRLLRAAAERAGTPDGRPRLLDIGCSNGNLLAHLRTQFPAFELHGGELFPEIIDHCRANPDLAGVQFAVMDVRDLGGQPSYDFIVSNAVIGRFLDADFALALASIARALRPGGCFLAFEYFHPFEQQIEVIEKSRLHPEGVPLVFRPYSQVRQRLHENGFNEVDFHPFAIPIDLPRPEDPHDTRTYTVRTDQNERLNFRGSLYLPWCHLVSRKG
jgi:SAM-dependent methyltransferase